MKKQSAEPMQSSVTEETSTQIIPTELTEEYREAIEMHCKVIAAKEQVCNALLDFAKLLKAMRDGNQYMVLGYTSFDDYIEKAINIQKRQVYNYISTYERLGADVLQSNAQLGITKLALLAEIPDIDRADFIESNDLGGMSVKEIKALIEQGKQQTEQISLLQTQIIESEETNLDNSSLIDQINAERERLEAELEALKAKPIDVAVEQVSDSDIKKIKAEAEKAAKSEYEAIKKQEIKAAEEKATAKANKDMEKKIDEAKLAAASAATEQLKQSLAVTEVEKAQALEKSEKLARELKVAVDGDMMTMQFYIDELSETFNKLTDKAEEIKKTDREKAVSLYFAIKNILKTMQEQVGQAQALS